MEEGKHFGGFKYRNKRVMSNKSAKMIWSPLFTALAGIIIKDLNSENSKIKMFANKLFNPKQITSSQPKTIEAEYKIINEKEDK